MAIDDLENDLPEDSNEIGRKLDRFTRADGTVVFLTNPPGQSGIVELTDYEHAAAWEAMTASYPNSKE